MYTMTRNKPEFRKTPSGVKGLDEVTRGGLPQGRPTLVCGAAGCGKTLMAIEFLVRGATELNEPGVFMMFEESSQDLAENVSSMGMDLFQMQEAGKIVMEHVSVERSEIDETGEYDLEALFIRLGHAVDRIGAKRVVLDTLEALFSGLKDEAILRSELRRLFRWMKDRDLTAVITAEKGDGELTRYGLEEYVADCVIMLDHRIKDQISTRRMRVVKYRGSSHGTNEYPFLIGDKGISVLPITSLKLDHEAPTERLSTGLDKLDEMFGGKGVFRGSSILVSGTPGTGKTSLGATFAASTCARGERCLIFSYEESPHQYIRNMASIGLDLREYISSGLLTIHASRPTLQGLEQHLVEIHDALNEISPSLVVIDPISNLGSEKDPLDVKPTLMRLIDILKKRNITALFTSLTDGSQMSIADSQMGVSSLMDTWILLRNMECNGENTRALYILKSRGMSHSNKVREFIFKDDGIDLIDVYVSDGQVLTGTARKEHERYEHKLKGLHTQELDKRTQQLNSKREALHTRIAAMKAQAESEAIEMELTLLRQKTVTEERMFRTTKLADRRDGVGPQNDASL